MDQLFSIERLDKQRALEIAANPDEVHIHDFEELIVGIRGRLVHYINCEIFTVDAPLVAFVAKGKSHRIITQLVDGDFDMWVLRFKSEFIAETIFQLYHSFYNNANVSLQTGTCFNRLGQICALIDQEMSGSQSDFSVVHHLLNALFIMIESEKKKVVNDDTSGYDIQNETFLNFLRILEDNFHRPMSVEFYAEKLFMTSRNLNLICQKIMNQSVSELIETRKLTEAKHLLATTNKSISEIGYKLGYSEKSYFSKVFKKKAGQTPSEFREEMELLMNSVS